MVNEENLDLEQLVDRIGQKYERDDACAIVILADGDHYKRFLSGNAKLMMQTLSLTAAGIIELKAESQDDMIHERMNMLRAMADECERLWHEHRRDDAGGLTYD